MEKLVMRKCCCKCGWSVHKCAIINAIISLILALLVFSSCIIDLTLNEPQANTLFETLIHYDDNDPHNSRDALLISRQVTYVFLINSIIAFIISIFNLAGVLLRRKGLVLPWLIYNGASFIGLLYCTVIFVVVFPLSLLMIFILPLYFYMYLIGHSFYFRLAAAEARAEAREYEAQLRAQQQQNQESDEAQKEQ